VSKLGRETPSRIRAWSLIRIEKPIVLFERHCHAAEKSEAIACGGPEKNNRKKNGGPRRRRGTKGR
jgi:hypothetical protein